MNKKVFSLICAVSCSFIWGTAFVAQDMGMDYIGPYTFAASRLLLGFLALLPFFFIFEYKKVKKNKSSFKVLTTYWFLIGFTLAAGNALQQISLLYTDVANSVFLSSHDVVVVSVLSCVFFSKKIHRSIWPSVLLCLAGGLFLSELNNIRVRFGDTLVIIGAFFWASHIILISKFLKIFNYPITIATFQCLTASIISFIPAFTFEYISLQVLLMESKELLYAGVLSSGLAFMLQVYGQQNLSPAPVAIIFSMEGVFGSIAAWVLLDQYLNEFKIFGIIVILSAVIFSQLAPMYDRKKHGRS